MYSVSTSSSGPASAARAQFCQLLREVHRRAGAPSYRSMCATANPQRPPAGAPGGHGGRYLTVATISRTLTGRTFPSWAVTAAILRAVGVTGSRLALAWRRCWEQAQHGQTPTEPAVGPVVLTAEHPQLGQVALTACERCSAVVLDYGAHQAWHDQLGRIAGLHLVPSGHGQHQDEAAGRSS
ncbi:hypothetical protein GCM10010174_80510 [Kutzneria viridogrisea]|uniref:Uncharacterized protein n=1 Tax=Kutzneria viridogrisea TaxID=47990 RepID=A0ABR6BYX2_9PSEU|nr:hypothetical protein [Kutzneria viridogrisea]